MVTFLKDKSCSVSLSLHKITLDTQPFIDGDLKKYIVFKNYRWIFHYLYPMSNRSKETPNCDETKLTPSADRLKFLDKMLRHCNNSLYLQPI